MDSCREKGEKFYFNWLKNDNHKFLTMVHRRTPALGKAIEKRQLPDTPVKSPKFLRFPRALMTSLSCIGPEGVKESDSGRPFCHPPGKYWVLEEKEQVL